MRLLNSRITWSDVDTRLAGERMVVWLGHGTVLPACPNTASSAVKSAASGPRDKAALGQGVSRCDEADQWGGCGGGSRRLGSWREGRGGLIAGAKWYSEHETDAGHAEGDGLLAEVGGWLVGWLVGDEAGAAVGAGYKVGLQGG
ncbi:unnamed protein product [Protopolystoma xenopodis]|uniref:Uncharacterized protein n=1 Tax=Protopolystoma xenopodis TaxID=117903 RepID=A0A448XL31_9PLAT|nr:unnamed protein product [Protopolystoma xenopodis]